jgi:hypothetical protein
MKATNSALTEAVIGLLILAILGFSFGSTKGFQEAQEVTVCPEGPPVCQFSRIQDAINASSYGATIRVGPGTYHENLFITHSLKLIGAGPDKTVLKSLSTLKWQDVILALGEIYEIQELIIESLTIRDIPDGGHAIQGGKVTSISVRASNIIYAPSEYAYLGIRGGLHLRDVSYVEIEGNTVEGGAIVIDGAGEVVVQDNVLSAGAEINLWEAMEAIIAQNTITEPWMIGICASASRLSITDNVVKGGPGAGISAGGDTVLIRGNFVSDMSGAGIGINGIGLELKDNIIKRNKVGVRVSGEGNIIEGNDIQDNLWYGIWATSLESVGTCKANVVRGNAQGDYVIGPAPGPFSQPSEELRQRCEGDE